MILTHRPIIQWPGELTKHRTRSRFEATHSQTVELLQREVRALTGSSSTPVAIQVALRESDIRLDAQPKANARSAEHPGVIISFDAPKLGPLQFSCDRFDDWQDNLRAIALAMEALRKIERYGIGTGTEQYRGWQQLGSGTPMGTSAQPVAMTVDNANRVMAMADGYDSAWLDAGDLEVRDVDRAYRTLAQQYHPDTGTGNAEQFRMIGARVRVLTKHLETA